MSLNFLNREDMLISIDFPSPFWSCRSDLYILFFPYCLVRIITGSSWNLGNFNLRVVKDAIASNIVLKGLSRMKL